MKRFYFFIILMTILMILPACGKKTNGISNNNSQESPIESINDGKKEDEIGREDRFRIPDFISEDLYGNKVTNSFFESSKLTILNIWTTT